MRRLLLAALFALACSSATTDPPAIQSSASCPLLGPGPSLDPSLVNNPMSGTSDAQWAFYARGVPGGWGGIYITGASPGNPGRPVILLVDTCKHALAAAALYVYGVGKPYDVRQSDAVPARWDFGQLYDWYNWINSQITVAGLTSTDIDEFHNRLAYGVSADSFKTKLQMQFDAMHLPTGLAVIAIEGVAGP